MISSEFLIVWAGQLLSAVGSGLTAFALGVYIFQMTGSAASYSLTIFFSFLPSFVLLPFTGVLADRFDRKKLMIIGDLGATTGLIFILASMLAGYTGLWRIYTGAALSSVFASIQIPAYKAVVTDLVTEEYYSKASGLIQLAGSAQYLISPIIAGVLMRFFNIKMILLLDIGTFVVAAIAVFIIKKHGTSDQVRPKLKFPGGIAASFQYLRSKEGIFYLVLLVTLVDFHIAMLQSLFGPMMLTFTDYGTMGMALSVSASGMLLSSLVIGMRGLKKNRVTTLSLFLAFAGLFYAFMGIFTRVTVIVVFGFLFFAALPFVNTSLEVLIRSNVDNEKQGRIWALVYSISQAGYLLALGSAGFLADRLFCPLFYPDGALAQSFGAIIGTGQGRGIGFMFIVSGLFVTIIAFAIGRIKVIKSLGAPVNHEFPERKEADTFCQTREKTITADFLT